MPRDHGSRDLPAVRNHPPGCWDRVQRASLHGRCRPWQTPGMARAVRDPASRASDRGMRTRIVGILATVIRILGWVFTLILVAYVALTLGYANPNNSITAFVTTWADRLALGFHDLFAPADPKLRVVLNYGLAAVFWFVVSSVLARLVRRLG